MDQPIRYTISFPELEAADAGRQAEGLRRTLQEFAPTIHARRARAEPDAMDFGTVLEIVLAAPAIIELAKGISGWLARTHSSKLTLTGADGTTIVENITAREATDLAERLRAAHGQR